jgi:hypothetical protein
VPGPNEPSPALNLQIGTLSPLPCWKDLEPHEHQARVRAMVREIEGEMEGVDVLGKERVCQQDP